MAIIRPGIRRWIRVRILRRALLGNLDHDPPVRVGLFDFDVRRLFVGFEVRS
jgi:hypothetical protein